MIGRVQTAVISSLQSHAVNVEVQVAQGLPRFSIIGLADHAVREARERVIAALSYSGITLPDQILVNLAPAELKKEGSGVDVAIAVGILVAAGVISQEQIEGVLFLGELGLNGTLKKVRGCVAHAAFAESQRIHTLVVPNDNGCEATIVGDLSVYGVDSLQSLILWLKNEPQDGVSLITSHRTSESSQLLPCLNEVIGQQTAVRGLTIAAAGGHNLLMSGPPGCGKTMLAEAFRSLLPALREEEMLAVAKIHSIAGAPLDAIIQGVRPFRAPHYGISESGLVGGGSQLRPGEASLAHCGVLFLDEFPEFRRDVIEALRVPLESGTLHIARAKGSYIIPARFQLIAAMNPCPCGRLGSKASQCVCPPSIVASYLRKLSQPLLDRIDLYVTLEPVDVTRLVSETGNAERLSTFCDTRSQIKEVQALQIDRFGKLNSELTGAEILSNVKLDRNVGNLLERIGNSFQLSARGYTRLLKVARTIADMDKQEKISSDAVAEAFSFRNVDLLGRSVTSSSELSRNVSRS